jgi:hypothetical protein
MLYCKTFSDMEMYATVVHENICENVLAIKQVTTSVPKTMRENIVSQAASILACYRQHCAAPSSAGQVSLVHFDLRFTE